MPLLAISDREPADVDPRTLSKSLDLRRCIDSSIGHDLLEHAKPGFYALDVRRVLSCLFGSQGRLRPDLLLLDPQPHLEWRNSDRGEGDQNPDPAGRIIEHRRLRTEA